MNNSIIFIALFSIIIISVFIGNKNNDYVEHITSSPCVRCGYGTCEMPISYNKCKLWMHNTKSEYVEPVSNRGEDGSFTFRKPDFPAAGVENCEDIVDFHYNC